MCAEEGKELCAGAESFSSFRSLKNPQSWIEKPPDVLYILRAIIIVVQRTEVK